MEPEGVSRIFARSVVTRNLQYTGYIGDGDSKSYSSIKASKPYDENPQHQNCPTGPGTWCKYNKALLQKKLFKHKNPLPTAIVDEIRPIYKKLTNDDIMNGCLGGYTQNSCEAINHLIWSRCPKISHSGRDHLDAAVAAAVVAFNDGSSGLARVLSHVGINPGSNMLLGLSARDRKRKRESNINASIVAKKIRQSRRKKKKSIEDSIIDKEGILYEAGAF
eukprot:gene5687-10932_t